jgi:hypothetical protein
VATATALEEEIANKASSHEQDNPSVLSPDHVLHELVVLRGVARHRRVFRGTMATMGNGRIALTVVDPVMMMVPTEEKVQRLLSQ